MRIAFQNAAVHEGAGIAFVAVADNILFGAGRFGNRSPFQTGWKPGATATAQTALRDFFDNLRRFQFGERVMQCRVTTNGDVIFDALRINDAAVGADDVHLLRKKRMLRISALHVAFISLQCADDSRRIFGLNKFPKPMLAILIHADQWPLPAESHTTDAANFDIRIQALRLGLGFKIFFDHVGLRGHAARRHAGAHDNFFARAFVFLRNSIEIVQLHN